LPKREPVKKPEPRQKEEEVDHEQEHVHMKVHKNPHCLKWGAWKDPCFSRIRGVYCSVKRVAEKQRSPNYPPP
jgi:hypothetical protein